jgi:hypothetical protein
MLRIFLTFLVVLNTFWLQNVFSLWENADELLIIPRLSWWANSLYNDINSDYWTAILESRANYVSPESIVGSQEKTQKINNYLNENFTHQFSSEEVISYNSSTSTEYAWDLKYTEYVDSIVVHHTHSEYDDDLTGLNQIHKYHSINRQWWDIWYNYIIWYDWVIYEWREWWDYVVWAHSKYNNFWTVWIAVLWNYESNWINSKQYQSLELLIKNLTQKYWIDLSKKRYYHMTCNWIKCDTFPIETYLDNALIWHRDATHTTCPWEKLYEQIQQIRTDNLAFTRWFKPIARLNNQAHQTTISSSIPQIHILLKVLHKYTKDELISINGIIEIKLKQDLDYEFRKKLQILRLAVILSYDD